MNLPGTVRTVVKAKAHAKAESSDSLTIEPRPLVGPAIVAPADLAEDTGHSHSSNESPELLFESEVSGSDNSQYGPMQEEYQWDRVKRNNEIRAQNARRHRERQQSDQ